MSERTLDGTWFGVRTIYRIAMVEPKGEGFVYEQRIVLIQAKDFDEAIARGEAEARTYADGIKCIYLGFVDVFQSFDRVPGDGMEVFSLMQTSALEAEDFITRYFDDGTEHRHNREG